MKIGGDYRVHPERNTWDKAARELGLHANTTTGLMESSWTLRQAHLRRVMSKAR
jgi:hypothetical protein